MDNKERIKLAAQAANDHKRRVDHITKTAAGLGNINMSGAMTAIGLIGAAVLINQFVKKMLQFAEQKNLERMKPEYFKVMLKKNPALLNEDPEEVMDLWDTMYRTSPHLAQDPVAAGGFIRQNIQARVRVDFGGPTIDTYKTLSGIEGDMKGAREPDTKDNFSGLMTLPFMS